MTKNKLFNLFNPYNPNQFIPLLKASSFTDLFASIRSWDYKLTEVPPSFKMGLLSSSGYCTITVIDSEDHFDSIQVTPTSTLSQCLADHMLTLDNDSIYFQIIVHKDYSSCVYANYNKIIGHRLVAKFGAKETMKYLGLTKPKKTKQNKVVDI